MLAPEDRIADAMTFVSTKYAGEPSDIESPSICALERMSYPAVVVSIAFDAVPNKSLTTATAQPQSSPVIINAAENEVTAGKKTAAIVVAILPFARCSAF